MKKETLEEFLARGGQITKVPAKTKEVAAHVMSPTNVGPATLLTYGEADLFYGEARARKSKKMKAVPKIDLSALPEALRKKYSKESLSEEN